MDIYVLNKDLNTVGIIDTYLSLIWTTRYYDVGECELEVLATAANLDLLQAGRYLKRPDDNMICIIRKINIKTSIENGNYLIVTGKDVKCLLYQRIVWNTTVFSTTTEAMIRTLAYNALGNASAPDRAIKNTNGNIIFELETLAGFTGDSEEQISYKNVGEKIYSICREKQWGVRFRLGTKTNTPSIKCFKFGVYAGEDKSDTIVFSQKLCNLAESDYSVDTSDMGNVTKIGGVGEGATRYMTDVGNATGIDRYEFFTDAKDIPRTIKYRELLEAYGGAYYEGQVMQIQHGAASVWAYCIKHLIFPVYSQTQLDDLRVEYNHGVVKYSGDGSRIVGYQAIENDSDNRAQYAPIAYVSGQAPESGSTVTMTDGFYDLYLINRGLQKIAEAGEVKKFTGTVQPYNYTYRADYNIGDVVTVSNDYGVTAQARIVEVTQVHDANGYQTVPKFEYQQINDVYVPAPNS